MLSENKPMFGDTPSVKCKPMFGDTPSVKCKPMFGDTPSVKCKPMLRIKLHRPTYIVPF